MNTGISRRRFLSIGAGAAAFAAAPFNILRAQTSEGASQPVRIGYLPITDATPLLIAHARGLYEAEGLKVEQPVLFRSWAEISEAFISGQVNVVHLLSPITVWLRYGKKFPVKVVAWNHTNGSALTVDADFQSVHDFAGKTVAVPFWYSIHNVVLQLLISGAGLKPVLGGDGKLADNEVRLVILPPPDMISALANKSIGGFIVAEPFNAAAEKLKAGKVLRFTGDVWQDHACCVVALREEDVSQNREWAQRVVNAVVKAQAWTQANREETAKILSKEGGYHYTPHPQAILERVLDERSLDAYVKSGAISHPEWHDPRIGFQPYPFPSYTEELVRRLKGTKVEGDNAFLEALDPAFAAGDLVDDSLVRTALGLAGGPAAFNLPGDLRRTETISA